MYKFIASILVLFALNLNYSAFGQISMKKVVTREQIIDNTTYDSTLNFLGEDVNKYIGQELYLVGKSITLRDFGYRDFYIDYNKSSFDKNNLYKCCSSSYSSKYELLANKYFTVLSVIKHPKSDENKILYENKYFFKLKEKESGDIIYYEYRSNYEHSFPFIIVGYYQKLKDSIIGKKFVTRGKNWIDGGEMKDMNTGKVLSNFEAGSLWKCVDVTIEEQYYNLSLILENDKGEQIPLSVKNSNSYYWVFNLNDSEKYKNKFGLELWNKILASKIKIGMTKEMCILSWGEPKKVNETITANTKSEQWVYDSGNYLYFTNGKVTAMQ